MKKMNNINNNDQEGKSNIPLSLPSNTDAEILLISAILRNNDSFEDVADFLLPIHFYDSSYRRVYEIIHSLLNKGSAVDEISLRTYFENDPILREAGGESFLLCIRNSFISTHNNRQYGEIIRDTFLRRQLIEVTEKVKEKAYNPSPEEDAHNLIESLEQSLFDLGTTGQIDKGAIPYKNVLHQVIESAEAAIKNEANPLSIATGLTDLDRWTGGGLSSSNMIVIAGRPSMGKTSLAMSIAMNVAKAGRPVAVFSLEMSPNELGTRFLSQASKVPFTDIKQGTSMSKDNFSSYMEIEKKEGSIPLYFFDQSSVTMSSIRRKARQLKRKSGLDLVVIDYIGLIKPSERKGKYSENRVQDVSEIARNLKVLARDLDVPVVVLSQLNRNVEARKEDNRPFLSDLKESGEIEQSADLVLLLYREEYYESRKEPPENTDKRREWQENMDRIRNMAELIIAKNRNGSVGIVKLFFDSEFTRFGNLDRRDNESIDKTQEKKTSPCTDMRDKRRWGT